MKRILLATLIFALIITTCSAASPWNTDYVTGSKGIFTISEYSGNGYMYAGAGEDGIIYYNDGSSGWVVAYDTASTSIRDIYEWSDGYLYFGAGSDGIIYRTNGTSLDTANDTPADYVYCFAPYNTKLYAGTGTAGLVYNTTDGLVWDESANTGEDVVNALKEYKSYLYAGTGVNPGKILRTLNGTGFDVFHTFTDENTVLDLEIYGEYLYIATGGDADEGNIYRTDGTSVELVYSPTTTTYVYDLETKDSVLYAACSGGYIYRTADGSNWEMDYYTLEPYVYSLGVDDSYIYAGTGFITGKIFSLYSNQSGEGWGFSYPPHDVRLTFIDEVGQGIDGATVTATPTETSLGAWGWLADLFGFDTDVNIGGTELQGTTGSDGSISFTLVPEIRYTISIVHAGDGINSSYSLYPKESEYFFRIGTLPVSTDYPEYNLTAEDVNSSYVRLSVSYLDAADNSEDLYFYVLNSSGSVVYDTSIELTAGGGTAYYDVENTRGTSYRFGFNVTNDEHGNVTSWTGIDMKGSGALVDFGWPDLYYNIISLAVIFLLAGAIGEADVRVGAIIVPIFAGLFWYIGWLPAAIGAIINIVLFIGAFYYIRSGMKAVDT